MTISGKRRAERRAGRVREQSEHKDLSEGGRRAHAGAVRGLRAGQGGQEREETKKKGLSG